MLVAIIAVGVWMTVTGIRGYLQTWRANSTTRMQLLSSNKTLNVYSSAVLLCSEHQDDPIPGIAALISATN